MVPLGRSHVEISPRGRRIASLAEDPCTLGPGPRLHHNIGPSLEIVVAGIYCSVNRVGILTICHRPFQISGCVCCGGHYLRPDGCVVFTAVRIIPVQITLRVELGYKSLIEFPQLFPSIF